jgi:hypothetical protein
MVRLMHRPDPFDREDPRGGEADIILGKHRSGPTAEFCHWRKAERIAEDRDRLAHNPEIAASNRVPATHCPRSAASEVRCQRTAGLKDRLGTAGNKVRVPFSVARSFAAICSSASRRVAA